ncbi:unnamed protein product [Caenorhabditis bovis]|uniref:ZP domain-containing protein n=1 Tax=Caenorhabditis bovis TaxID=2654633 RepID=A0A8S1EA18_9PELO|nr:unnamed protein product [Caenorhabditis bovis]
MNLVALLVLPYFGCFAVRPVWRTPVASSSNESAPHTVLSKRAQPNYYTRPEQVSIPDYRPASPLGPGHFRPFAWVGPQPKAGSTHDALYNQAPHKAPSFPSGLPPLPPNWDKYPVQMIWVPDGPGNAYSPYLMSPSQYGLYGPRQAATRPAHSPDTYTGTMAHSPAAQSPTTTPSRPNPTIRAGPQEPSNRMASDEETTASTSTTISTTESKAPVFIMTKNPFDSSKTVPPIYLGSSEENEDITSSNFNGPSPPMEDGATLTPEQEEKEMMANFFPRPVTEQAYQPPGHQPDDFGCHLNVNFKKPSKACASPPCTGIDTDKVSLYKPDRGEIGPTLVISNAAKEDAFRAGYKPPPTATVNPYVPPPPPPNPDDYATPYTNPPANHPFPSFHTSVPPSEYLFEETTTPFVPTALTMESELTTTRPSTSTSSRPRVTDYDEGPTMYVPPAIAHMTPSTASPKNPPTYQPLHPEDVTTRIADISKATQTPASITRIPQGGGGAFETTTSEHYTSPRYEETTTTTSEYLTSPRYEETTTTTSEYYTSPRYEETTTTTSEYHTSPRYEETTTTTSEYHTSPRYEETTTTTSEYYTSPRYEETTTTTSEYHTSPRYEETTTTTSEYHTSPRYEETTMTTTSSSTSRHTDRETTTLESTISTSETPPASTTSSGIPNLTTSESSRQTDRETTTKSTVSTTARTSRFENPSTSEFITPGSAEQTSRITDRIQSFEFSTTTSPRSTPSPFTTITIQPFTTQTTPRIPTRHNPYVPPEGAPRVPNRVIGKPKILCKEDGITFEIKTILPLSGSIFANDRKRHPECSKVFSDDAHPKLFLPFKECGVKNVGDEADTRAQYHIQVVLEMDQGNGTNVVQSFMSQCVLQKINYNKQVLPKRIEEALEELHLVPSKLEQKASMPTAVMQIVVDEGHHKLGPEVMAADIGMPLAIRWSLEPESDAYGLHVRNCKVVDAIGHNEHVLIDEHGCSADVQIIDHPHYDTYHDTASAHMWAFKVPDMSSLRIKCDILICSNIKSTATNATSCDAIPSPPFCADLVTSPQNSILSDASSYAKPRRNLEAQALTAVSQSVRATLCVSKNCQPDYIDEIRVCVNTRLAATSTGLSIAFLIFAIAFKLIVGANSSR